MATTIIGPKANSSSLPSEVNTYIKFLSNPATQIPVDSNFFITFNLPGALTAGQDVWNTLENRWGVFSTLKDLQNELDSQKNKTIGNDVCLFAQGINVPGESVGTQRNDPLAGPSGGLLSGVVSTGRAQYSDITVSFLETNKSFIDFVVRPWITLVGHYGLISRASGSTQNVRTDISVVFFDKNNNDTSNKSIRKIFKFTQCAPVSLGETSYSYGKAEIRIEAVKFVFNNYQLTYRQGQT